VKFPSLPIINKELISGLNPGKYILNVEYNTKNISVYTFSIATDSSDAVLDIQGNTLACGTFDGNQATLARPGHGFYVIKVEQNLKMVNFR